LVECRPETGRKHQLRVHLDSLGHPVLGDKLYGQPPEVFLSLLAERDPEKVADLPDLQEMLGHPRHCLHAHELRFELPGRGAFCFTAPLSPDMQQLLDM
jgi:23S rRNA pseudouridine1911/1915/1917 synthase